MAAFDLMVTTEIPIAAILRAHAAWLDNPRDGRQADLSQMTLNDWDLAGARLSRAILTGATLLDANLSRADLSGVKLERADLQRANLACADLSGAALAQTV